MKAYYAHCVALYDTPQEHRDRLLLGRLGYTIYDPDSPEVDAEIARLKAANPTGDYMEFFRGLVTACDVFAFRALPDGRIPAGVAKELGFAVAAGMPIFELPSGVLARSISVEETREYLHEVGQR
jgi:hypothetical protein